MSKREILSSQEHDFMASLWPFEVETHSAHAEPLPLCSVAISEGIKGYKKQERQL